MKWMVYRDVLANKEFFIGNALRFNSPAEAVMPVQMLDLMRANPKCQEFRLLDDDGLICCEGVCIGLDDADGDAAFAPLDALEGYFGCTSMQYKDGNQWVEL